MRPPTWRDATGAARAVSVREIEQGIHKVESLLAPFKPQPQAIPSEFYTLFYKTVDAIEEAGLRLREEQSLENSPIRQLLSLLDDVIASGIVPSEELERLPIGIEPHRKVHEAPATVPVPPEPSVPVEETFPLIEKVPIPEKPSAPKPRGTSSVRVSPK